jgi:lysophospholipase L1-like esterase
MRLRNALRESVSWIVSSLISLAVLAALVEIGYQLFKPSIYTNDSLLGWNLRANARATFVQRDFEGKEYAVDFRTDADALRTFGSNPDAPHRILVLGDSFTGEPSASNDRMWFASMAETLAHTAGTPENNFFVWAGGAGGWGTYQNLLLAKTLSKKLHPTLLILQFCTNDYSNNHFEWETMGITRNQTMRRPYADPANPDQPTYHRGPVGWLYRSILGDSKVFNSLDSLVQRIEFNVYGGYGKPIPPTTEMRFQEEAVNLTRVLLGKLRQQFPDVPAAMISCDGEQGGLSGRWVGLAKDTGFIPLVAPAAFLSQARAAGDKKIFGQDGTHLSEQGNLAFGAIVAESLIAHGVHF